MAFDAVLKASGTTVTSMATLRTGGIKDGEVGMIVFELTMPHCGSWNGKWSQESKCHIRTKSERVVPKEYWNRDFYYRWDDGWEACVSVRQMDAREARRLEKKSDGFCGYDWMIDSICEKGMIEPKRR